ncbi:MAG: ABC transporter ATP-binding protein [Alphaproteobacteria bacterium]|nr:ABC transporter ATP-binding protein [Alphaproteobacteria bacterium]
MGEVLLSVRGLSTNFHIEGGVVRAVDDVSFDLAEGETLAIVGESGSGKSVTALSLLRLIPEPPGQVSAASVRFDGRELGSLDPAALRAIRGNSIAMIFQEPMSSLNPALTVGMQVAEPLNRHRAMPWPEALKEAGELLRKVQIADPESRLGAYPHHFSGGMRQRVMIAMALACRPKLIIADEPTTALDVTVQAQILELLKTLTRESRAALILITHDLGVVARYADRVCVMYAGRLVETGPARTIYETPRHPYTIGLMASVPRLDEAVGRKLVPIEGQPPDLADLPPGCAFLPRCNRALARCATERPMLASVGQGHERACWADV